MAFREYMVSFQVKGQLRRDCFCLGSNDKIVLILQKHTQMHTLALTHAYTQQSSLSFPNTHIHTRTRTHARACPPLCWPCVRRGPELLQSHQLSFTAVTRHFFSYFQRRRKEYKTCFQGSLSLYEDTHPRSLAKPC